MRFVQKQQLYEQASEVVADNKAGRTKIGKGQKKKSPTINTDSAEMVSGKYRTAKQKQDFLHNQRQLLGSRIIIKIASYLPSCGADVVSHAIPFLLLHILHIPTVSLISSCISKVLRQRVFPSLIHRWIYWCWVHLFKSTNSAGLASVYLIWPGSTIDSSHLSQQHHWTHTHSEHRRPTTPQIFRPQLPCKVRNSQRSLQRAGQLSNSMTATVKVEPTLLVLWICLGPSVAKAEQLTCSGWVD